MITAELLERHLPPYLIGYSREAVIKEIDQFVNSETLSPFYKNLERKDLIYQGDGLHGLIIADPIKESFKEAKCIVLSNTCDLNPSNERFSSKMMCYAPIVSLDKYKSSLEKAGKNTAQIDGYFFDIRKQAIWNLFYLPKGGPLDSEGVTFLDRVNNINPESINRDQLSDQRIFSLNDFGLWLFIFKLSVHFTRFGERLARGS